MGSTLGPAARGSDNDGDDDDPDQPSLAEVLDGVLADVDVDSVEEVREIRQDE